MSIMENPTVKWFQSWPRWAALLVTGIVYLILAELGLLFTFDDSRIATVWPATGFALAAMLLLGYRIWPALTVAAFLASAVSYGMADAPVPELLLASLSMTAGNILPVMMSVYLLKRFTGIRNPFDRVVDVFKYLLLAGLVSTAIGATIGVTGVSMAGLAEWSDWGSLWLIWWMGAASSNLIIAPLILVWVLEPRIDLSPLKVVEAVLSLAAFIGSMVLITLGSSESGESSPLIGILIFPLLFSFIWASVRFGHRGATVILAVFWVMLVWVTYADPNTRTPRPMHEAVMIAQFYMVVIAALTLVPAAMIKERRKTESNLIEAKEDIERGSAQLYQANLELKREIAERERAQVELERSNRELQQFAYVASHDLQEPLRMVASFVQLLEEGYADKLDDKAREFIGFSVEGVTRMQKMIDDLLDYSRVGTRGEPLKPVDTEAALAQAVADLRYVIEDSGAEVTHDRLPRIEADQLQIAQVFQNLISNGIRFRGQEPPRIHIAAGRTDGFWEFSVRDNGMGIDPKYFDRIFVIFQRLNKRRDYPGTGIGLALCKRIVERHGGEIRVESEPGRGATFYFTIPASGGEQT